MRSERISSFVLLIFAMISPSSSSIGHSMNVSTTSALIGRISSLVPMIDHLDIYAYILKIGKCY